MRGVRHKARLGLSAEPGAEGLESASWTFKSLALRASGARGLHHVGFCGSSLICLLSWPAAFISTSPECSAEAVAVLILGVCWGPGGDQKSFHLCSRVSAKHPRSVRLRSGALRRDATRLDPPRLAILATVARFRRFCTLVIRRVVVECQKCQRSHGRALASSLFALKSEGVCAVERKVERKVVESGVENGVVDSRTECGRWEIGMDSGGEWRGK